MSLPTCGGTIEVNQRQQKQTDFQKLPSEIETYVAEIETYVEYILSAEET